MAMQYYATFDVSQLSLGTLTIATAGESNAVVTLGNLSATGGDGASSQKFNHALAMSTIVGDDPDSTARFQDHAATGFAATMQAAMRAAATTAAWSTPNSLTCTFNTTTAVYTFGYSTTFSLTWSNHTQNKRLFGFSGNSSGASSYASDQTPYYAILPTGLFTSDPTDNYEPSGIASRAVADNGAGFGFARTTSPLYRDWIQQFETKEKTLRMSAASTHPFTFQHLFEHCRTVYSFVVGSGFNDAKTFLACHFREDACQFEGGKWRASPGNDAQFHIPFKVHVEGHEP